MTQPQQPPNPYLPPPPPAMPAMPAAVPAQPDPWAAPQYGAPLPAAPQYGTQPYGAQPYGGAPYGYGQGGYQQQYGYPQAAPPAYGYGYPGVPACRICGGIPAADVTVRRHQGLVLVMRFYRSTGPFCQVCGTAVVRDMSEKTLWGGWWSYVSSLITVVTLFRNRSAYQQLRQLPPPPPGSHGPQLDPGRPLTRRAAIWMLLLPVVAVLLAVVLPIALAASSTGTDTSADTGGSTSTDTGGGSDIATVKAGDCIHDSNGASGADDGSATITIVSCTSSQADYLVMARVASLDEDGSTACAPYPRATHYFTHRDGAQSFVLCLAGPGTSSGGGSGSSGDGGTDGGSGSSGGSGSAAT